jgi:hypothetical protein
MKKLEIRHTSKGGFGFVRSLIRVPQPWDEWLNEWMDASFLHILAGLLF